MTLDEMIEQLEEAREDLGGDAQVRIAYQPSWPLRATVAAVTIPGSPDREELYDEGERAPGQDDDGKFCWIAAGSVTSFDENPYAPRWAWGDDGGDWS